MRVSFTLTTRLTSQRLSGYGFLHQETNKMKHILLLMLLCILFCAASCKKEQPDPPPDLPPLTNVGAMTFGCYVNGEPWVAEVPPLQPNHIHLSGKWYLKDSILIISASRLLNDRPGEHISIKIENFCPDSFVYFDNSAHRVYTNFGFRCPDNIANNYFSIASDSINEFDFRQINIQNRIVSGIFNQHVYADNCTSEVISISDGRFDLFVSVIE